MGFIKRNTIQLSPDIIILCVSVRSILEYGVIVWHPYLAKDSIVSKIRFFLILPILKIVHPRHD